MATCCWGIAHLTTFGNNRKDLGDSGGWVPLIDPVGGLLLWRDAFSESIGMYVHVVNILGKRSESGAKSGGASERH